MGRVLVGGIVAVALLAACSGSDDGAAGTAPTTAPSAVTTTPTQLGDRPCDTPPSLGPTACYWLEVPERRDVADSRTIKLWVAVVTPADARPDALPLVFLPGGPGGDVSSAARSGPLDFALGDNPLVLVDPRGTGRSEPDDLGCPELTRPLDASHPWPDRVEQQRDQADACRSRLEAAGVDLNGYGTTENAADLVDLRRALGYEKWTVWGLSYGGRTAQEVVNQDPDGVAAVILDSPLTYRARGLASAVAADKVATHHLVAACSASPSCTANTPDLQATIDAAVATLDSEPAIATGKSNSGAAVPVLITGQEAIAARMRAQADADTIPVLPGAALGLANRDPAALDLVAGFFADPPGGPIALSYITQCADEGGARTSDDAAVAADPGDYGTLLLGSAWLLCDDWNVDPVPGGQLSPAKTDVPVLVFEGALDPIVAPDTAAEITAGMPRAQVVVIPAGSHSNALATECSRSLVTAFLADPGAPLDTSCVASLPQPFAP